MQGQQSTCPNTKNIIGTKVPRTQPGLSFHKLLHEASPTFHFIHFVKKWIMKNPPVLV